MIGFLGRLWRGAAHARTMELAAAGLQRELDVTKGELREARAKLRFTEQDLRHAEQQVRAMGLLMSKELDAARQRGTLQRLRADAEIADLIAAVGQEAAGGVWTVEIDHPGIAWGDKLAVSVVQDGPKILYTASGAS